jgi:hypothetical protein
MTLEEPQEASRSSRADEIRATGESTITEPSATRNQLAAVASAATKGSRTQLGTYRPSTATTARRNAIPGLLSGRQERGMHAGERGKVMASAAGARRWVLGMSEGPQSSAFSPCDQ